MPTRRAHRRPDRDEQRSSQRDPSVPTTGVTTVAERVPVQRLQMAMHQPGQARPGDLLALQRMGGNQAMLQRLAAGGQTQGVVHRTIEEDLAAGFGGGGGAVEPLSGVTMLGGDIAQGAGTTNGAPNWSDPNASPVSGAAETGITGSSVGGAMQIVGLGLASKGVHDARRDKAEAIQQGKKTKAREADRRLRMGGADVGARAYGVGSSVVDVTARGFGIAAQTNTALTSTAGALGAGAAGVALPLTAFQAGRDLRKAIKAGQRVRDLEALKNTWDNARSPKVLQTIQEQLDAVDAQIIELTDKKAEASAEVAKWVKVGQDVVKLPAKDPRKANYTQLLAPKLKEVRDLVASLDAELTAARKTKTEVATQLADATQTKQAIDAALTATERAGHRGDVTLEIIQAYAYKKNQRGVVKKVTSFLGGALGVGAGVAGLVASIAIATGAAAGAAALMATPVGWGLAAAAAAVGLGLGIYKAVRFFSKRWKQTEHMKDAQGQALTKAARLGKTLAFWRSTGKSKREEYGEALWKMAHGGNDKAKDLIKALGLDWVKFDMGADKDNAVKLIAAKLAS